MKTHINPNWLEELRAWEFYIMMINFQKKYKLSSNAIYYKTHRYQ